MKSQIDLYVPFHYGSGSMIVQVAGEYLNKAGLITLKRYENGGMQALWSWCRDRSVILRVNEAPAKLAEVKDWGKGPEYVTPKVRKAMERKERLMPGGVPRYIRVYDNGGQTYDRWTVIFTKKRVSGQFMYLGMSDNPYAPNGIGLHGESECPTMANVGKKVPFDSLPDDCKRLVISDYKDLWGLK